MALLMNLALLADQLSTKYMNTIFVVGRGQYDELGLLLLWVIAIGLIVPVLAIAVFGRRIVR